jgi:hypothetical protein
MAPSFKVTVARRCEPRVKALRGEAKKSFERVIEELRHRGCEAGGTRMRAETGEDHHVCERRFYRERRMHLVFGDQDEIVISWVGQHTEDEAVHVDGARDIPGLSGIGRSAARPSMIHPSTSTWYDSSIRSAPPVATTHERAQHSGSRLEITNMHLRNYVVRW